MGWRPLNGTRTARLVGIGTLAAVIAAGTAFILLPLAVRAFFHAIVLTSNACVWFAGSLGAGVDMWTILATIGRSAGAALINAQALAIAGGLVLAGAIALYGLQRLLGSEEESSR
jgi:hypothetical protein